MFVSCECRVLSGRGLCDELITRPEESYQLWCVVVCDLETSRMRMPWSAFGRWAMGGRECIIPNFFGSLAIPSPITCAAGIVRFVVWFRLINLGWIRSRSATNCLFTTLSTTALQPTVIQMVLQVWHSTQANHLKEGTMQQNVQYRTI
jgi:hypothetical protein